MCVDVGRNFVVSKRMCPACGGELPPTFYTYGSEDPFYEQFMANADAVRDAGVMVEEHVLEGWPHGFGVEGEWTRWFDAFLSGITCDNEE